jgi:DNA-binding MarR family transcriptional regulator
MASTIFDTISDPVSAQVIVGLAKIGTALKSHAWKEAGNQWITPTQGAILALLHGRPQREWRLTGVATALAISAATASDAIGALARKGLVTKLRSEGDQRAISIQLTPRGRSEAERSAHWPDFLLRAVDGLSRPEQEVLYRTLIKMIRALQERGEVPVSRMCVTCQFFRPHLYADPETPHHCAFVDAPFGERHLRLECPEHTEATTEARQENWARFIEPGLDAGTA